MQFARSRSSIWPRASSCAARRDSRRSWSRRSRRAPRTSSSSRSSRAVCSRPCSESSDSGARSRRPRRDDARRATREARPHRPARVDRSRYADLFLTESREHLSAITQSWLELERTSGGAASVSALFRSVHTIKGMSATMGYTAVAELSHELEALLDRIRAGIQVVNGEIVDLLFASTDALEKAIEMSVAGREGDADVAAPLARLRTLAESAAQPHGSGGAVEGIPSALASPRRLSRSV